MLKISAPYLNRFSQPDSIILDHYNSQDWDRYNYARNNSIKYTDPSGHCVWDLCIVEGVGLIEVTAVALGAITATFYATTPPPAELTRSLEWANQQIAKAVDTISTSINNTVSASESNALLMKGEYVPPVLEGYLHDLERKLYGKAVEAYKKEHNIPGNVNVPKDILDGIADDILNHVKPEDAAANASEPPDGLVQKGRPKEKLRRPDLEDQE